MFIGHKSTRLLDVLISQGKVKADMIDAETMKNLPNWRVEEILRDERIVTSEDLAKAYSQICSLPFISLKGVKIAKEALAAIPEKFAREYKIIPHALEGNGKILKVAVSDPGKLSADLKNKINQINAQKGIEVQLAIVTPDDFNQALSNYLAVQEVASQPQSPTPPAPVASEEQKNPAELREIDLKDIKIPFEVISKFPEDIARKYRMVVFDSPHPSFIKVAVADPENKKMREILDFVKENNDIAIEEYLAKPDDIYAAMRFYGKADKDISNKSFDQGSEHEDPLGLFKE